MKRKITFFVIALLLPLLGMAQAKDCLKYRNGTFAVTDPASKKVCIITRNGNTQTEKMQDADEVYDFNIVWIDDCTYTVSPTPATIARNKDVTKAGTITVKIIKTNESSYVQRITVANNPKFRRIDEVFLVPEKKE